MTPTPRSPDARGNVLLDTTMTPRELVKEITDALDQSDDGIDGNVALRLAQLLRKCESPPPVPAPAGGPEEREETRWLIEAWVAGEVWWWKGGFVPSGPTDKLTRGQLRDAFTLDANEAVGFCREQDANAILRWFNYGGVKASEHNWAPRAALRPAAGASEPPAGATGEARTWRCFHCDEVYTNEAAAREHFGDDGERDTAACKLNRGEGELVARLREVNREATHLRSALEQAEYDSGAAVRAQIGYEFPGCATLRDVFNKMDSLEGRALAAEERLAASAPSVVSGPPHDMDSAGTVDKLNWDWWRRASLDDRYNYLLRNPSILDKLHAPSPPLAWPTRELIFEAIQNARTQFDAAERVLALFPKPDALPAIRRSDVLAAPATGKTWHFNDGEGYIFTGNDDCALIKRSAIRIQDDPAPSAGTTPEDA